MLATVPTRAAGAQSVPGFCSAPNKIEWPTVNPVWSLCWVSPPDSSGIDGSGLELRHVFYKGKRVFWRAHVPVLNVQYDPGGCGGPSLSYRDWQTELAPFAATNVIAPGYAEPATPPATVCDHPGTDAGTFAGVAVEKRSDRLILTTQMSAGWYRYVQTWTFHLDGTIEPRLGFTAVDYPCTTLPHTHHAYWRFDFDIDGAADDVIEQRRRLWWFPIWFWRDVDAEFSAIATPLRERRIRDATTGRGYRVIPGSHDGVADAWAVADVWGLRYHDDEIDDGGATGGPTGDAVHVSDYLTGESIEREDVVLWYHASHRHAGGIGCQMSGPTLKPVGFW
jgi:hypothetical protein